MRVVVTSDTHGDWVTDGFERTGDVAVALEQVSEYCGSGTGDLVFMHLGDCANPYSRGVHRAMAPIYKLAATLNMYGQTNVWLTGNHDIVESGRLDHTLVGLKEMAGVEIGCSVGPMMLTHVVDQPKTLRLGARYQFGFIGLPYTAPSHSYDPARFIEEVSQSSIMKDAEKVIIAGHLMIEGIGAGSETTDMRRGRDVFFPIEACNEYFPDAFLLNGHYHEQQVFKGIHIPGEPVRLTHGEEANKPSFLVVDL